MTGDSLFVWEASFFGHRHETKVPSFFDRHEDFRFPTGDNGLNFRVGKIEFPDFAGSLQVVGMDIIRHFRVRLWEFIIRTGMDCPGSPESREGDGQDLTGGGAGCPDGDPQ